MTAHSTDNEIDLNGDSAEAAILRFCGKAKRILDIGAGNGGIAKWLIDQGSSVVCVEKDLLAAKRLRRFCKDVYEIDVDDAQWSRAIEHEGIFNYIIVSDVLEQLDDPIRLLAALPALLAPKGEVLASCAGPFDNVEASHFSIQHFANLIEAAGFRVIEGELVRRPPAMSYLPAARNRLDPATVGETRDDLPPNDVYRVVARLGRADETDKHTDLTELRPHQPETAASPVRLIAFYLPQFHPIKQNDVWWGKGFTEWTNVTKARPLFGGHYQPHLPADLGFYDLRVGEVRRDQIRLAKDYGIDGFCYYFYWFSGERLLERPLEEMLADTDSDMPFCLCWANENWTRKWDGESRDVLIAQKHLPTDDARCIADMMPCLKDSRYIRYNGRVLIIVYNPQHLNDAQATARCWRQACIDAGIGEPFLVAAQAFGNKEHLKFGFDASVEFPPHNLECTHLNGYLKSDRPMSGWVYDYAQAAEQMLQNEYQPSSPQAGFRTVVPSWDNTARTGVNGCMLLNGTPENYEVWLDKAIRKTREDTPTGDRLVFINAWNEWAEGCHLEPDRLYGRQFLEATLRAKKGLTKHGIYPRQGLGDYDSDPSWVSALGRDTKPGEAGAPGPSAFSGKAPALLHNLLSKLRGRLRSK